MVLMAAITGIPIPRGRLDNVRSVVEEWGGSERKTAVLRTNDSSVWYASTCKMPWGRGTNDVLRSSPYPIA